MEAVRFDGVRCGDIRNEAYRRQRTYSDKDGLRYDYADLALATVLTPKFWTPFILVSSLEGLEQPTP